ncbi:MAG: thioredoxin [Armatimonadota bacterium]|nr:thioredoxin [Armatimonadota bacterium]
MSAVTAVENSNFESEVVQAGGPVVVDFWAEWCVPCKRLSPILESVAAKFDGRVKVVKCNIEQNRDLIKKYDVKSIPNLLFFKDGKVVDQSLGLVSEAVLASKVAGLLQQ